MYALAITLLIAGQSGPKQQMPRRVHSSDSQLAIKVRLDGDMVKFERVAPIMEGSRILVPLRGVFEHLGATLRWSPEDRTVYVTGGGKDVVLPVGKSWAKLGGESVRLDQPAMIVDDATYVPLRFLSESLGAKVEWLGADRVVDIKSRGGSDNGSDKR